MIEGPTNRVSYYSLHTSLTIQFTQLPAREPCCFTKIPLQLHALCVAIDLIMSTLHELFTVALELGAKRVGLADKY